MWNKWLAALQEPVYKRLGIALGISALLHVFLVGQFYLLLPDNKPELHTIEARLQMPKTVTKPTNLAKPVVVLPENAPVKPEKPVNTKQLIEPEQFKEVTPTAEPLPIENTTPTVEQLSEVIVPTDAAPSKLKLAEPLVTGDPIPMPADALPQPVDEGMVINENAYQYVETTFNVSTKIGGSPEGCATMTYSLLDGAHYQIKSVAKARGLAALLLSELLQTSEGELTKTGLRPSKFTYNYGDKAIKSRLATFDWQAKTVSMQTATGTQIEPLPDEA